MKKVIIFLAAIIVLFIAVGVLTNMQNTAKVDEDNLYQKDTLHPETVAQLDDPNYQNIILPETLTERLNKGENMTVYFYSPTCAYCKQTTPIVSPLAQDLGIDLVQYNLLEFKDGWDDYHITETPTIIHFENGAETERISGLRDKDFFENWFEEHALEDDGDIAQ